MKNKGLFFAIYLGFASFGLSSSELDVQLAPVSQNIVSSSEPSKRASGNEVPSRAPLVVKKASANELPRS